ncbi:helix-turn-helix domain-containing protein [Virgibacillus alimentarius]
MNNPSLINRWMKEFNEQGVEGLKPKPKGRPSGLTPEFWTHFLLN